ncbi:hypothetical protein D3C87_1626740 [compost metagenome]
MSGSSSRSTRAVVDAMMASHSSCTHSTGNGKASASSERRKTVVAPVTRLRRNSTSKALPAWTRASSEGETSRAWNSV